MTGIFLSTMFIHFQKFDSEYFYYGLIRILFIAIVSGLISAILHKHGNKIKFLLGVVSGPIIALVMIKS